MKKLFIALLASLNLAALPALAADTPASDAAVRRLLEVSKSRKLLDNLMLQIDGMMKSSMKTALAGESYTAEQEAVLDEMQKDLAALLKEELTWEVMEPVFIDMYKKTFTQKEINAMINFYKTPAGQAVINKLPMVVQSSMQMMEGKMASMMSKLEKIANDSVEKLKKLAEKK